MTATAVFQAAVLILALVLPAFPMGRCIARCFADDQRPGDAVFLPVEGFIWKICGINSESEMDMNLHLVKIRGAERRLTPAEYEPFRMMMMHRGKALTHRQLLTGVWGAERQEENREQSQLHGVYHHRTGHRLSAESSLRTLARALCLRLAGITPSRLRRRRHAVIRI